MDLGRCDCQEASARLSALVDGELGLLDRLRIRLHLASCPPCARAARQLAATLSALGRLAGRGLGRRLRGQDR